MKKATTLDAAESFNALATTGDAPLTYDQAFEMMEKADDKELQALSSDYFTFSKIGEKVSFVVLGFDTATIQGKSVEVVKLADKDGKQYINGDKVLVSSSKRLQVLPAYIRVEYVKDVKTPVGTYKDLLVKTFPIPTEKS
jgi:hypothetical protein